MRLFRKIAKMVLPEHLRPKFYLDNLVKRKTQSVIAAGPFSGMKYVDRAFSSQLIPKLIGTYERELHEVLERCFLLDFKRLVDIGAAEGFYAVGFALRSESIHVVAFESDTKAKEQLSRMADMNGCSDRLDMRGFCTLESLAEAVQDGSGLIICDCEGFEVELLNPIKIPALMNAHVLVEMHDFIVPGATEELVSRFRKTHQIRTIKQETRSRSDFPYQNWYVRLLPESDVVPNEGRPVMMHWLWMEPLA